MGRKCDRRVVRGVFGLLALIPLAAAVARDPEIAEDDSEAVPVVHVVALLCAGIFTGAAVYISVVQHPAAREAGVGGLLFPRMYARAAPMQASLAILGTLAGLLAGVTAGSIAEWRLAR